MSINLVLFDSPGPRGRRLIRIIATIVAVTTMGLIAVALQRFAANGQLAPDKWQPFTQWPYLRFLAEDLQGTLEATAVAAVLSFPLGAVLAILRLSRNPVLRNLATGCTRLLRSLSASASDLRLPACPSPARAAPTDLLQARCAHRDDERCRAGTGLLSRTVRAGS